MDGILRRRSMMQAEETTEVWEDVSSVSASQWTEHPNWSVSGGTFTCNPTIKNWNYRISATHLKYQWGNIKNTAKKVKIEFDYTITGMVSGDQFAVSYGLFSGKSNGNRQAFKSLQRIEENGSGHYSAIASPIEFTNGTINDSHWLGTSMYAYASSGSHFEISNITMEVCF